MKSSSQFSDVLHVLLHIAQSPSAVTSEALAVAMKTNPVVLRRLMAGMRDAGLVRSEKGHGGGWTMVRPLKGVSLRDVHLALGAPALVSLGFREDRPECVVAQVVNESLLDSVRQAEEVLLARLGGVTLADLFEGVHARMAEGWSLGAPPSHLLEDHHDQD